MLPKVVVIILNWNGWRDTIECLKSLAKVNYRNFEAVVVDNGSTDDSAEKLEEFINSSNCRLPVLIYKLSSNLGFAGGNNYVLDKVNAEYILLLNNDTIVSPDFLRKLVDVAGSDESAGIAGPMIYFYNYDNYINSAGSKINWLMNKGKYIGYNKKDIGQFGDKPYEVDYISGACLLIKKKVIDKIGGLCADYFLYYEDTDWNFQAKKAGYKSVLVPTSKIWHKESASAKKIGVEYIYYHTRNGILFNKRCAPFYKKIIIHFYNLYVFAKQMIKLLIPSKKEWAKAVIKGMGDYYRGQFGKLKIRN
jgi:GT2 family glycosyltransferase